LRECIIDLKNMIQVDIENHENQTNIRRGYENEKRERSRVKK